MSHKKSQSESSRKMKNVEPMGIREEQMKHTKSKHSIKETD